MSKASFSFLLIFILMLSFISIGGESAAAGIEKIDSAESAGAALETNQAGHQDNDVVWIDVRSWAEHQLDNIEGDTRIHFSEIVEQIGVLYPNKNTRIRLYCAVGGRAQKALNSLKAAGYTNLENVGGIEQARKLRELTNE